tara:strand:+ start:797 stop:1087 length:291 start_codon:yes stop_codon:yes gene_type:complete
MLNVDEAMLAHMEQQYPGITEQIWRFEIAVLPPCPDCGDGDTADVQVGLIGRTIHISMSTTKFKLIPNGPKLGDYFCNACEQYFGSGWRASSSTTH